MGHGADNIREIGSAEFVSSLTGGRAGADAFPLAGSLDLTDRCNLRCDHCYVPRPKDSAQDGLALEDVCAILDKLAAQGVLAILLTGGEPLLRPDFRQIYLRAKQLGFLITLFTNATLVDGELADFLAAWPPRRVEVTLYGATAKTYDGVVRESGSFARFQAGVELLRGRGLHVRAKFLVTHENRNELETAMRWARNRRLPFRSDSLIAAGLTGDPAPLRLRVSPQDAARMAMRGKRECDPVAHRPRGPGSAAEAAPLFACGAGLKTFHVDATGYIHPCALWRVSAYDFLHGTPEGWREHVAALRASRMPADSGCSTCPDRTICPVCPALSLLETGEAGHPVGYYCKQVAAMTEE